MGIVKFFTGKSLDRHTGDLSAYLEGGNVAKNYSDLQKLNAQLTPNQLALLKSSKDIRKIKKRIAKEFGRQQKDAKTDAIIESILKKLNA